MVLIISLIKLQHHYDYLMFNYFLPLHHSCFVSPAMLTILANKIIKEQETWVAYRGKFIKISLQEKGCFIHTPYN